MTPLLRRSCWGLLVPLALVLAGCGSGGDAPPPDASLENANYTVQSAMTSYVTTVAGCERQSSPVVCLEAADRTLGNKIHAYANMLAGHHPFKIPTTDRTTTLNAAQTLANSLEILGDAQPTQANYNQVLNTYNLNSAIIQLQSDVMTLARSLGK